MGTNPLTKILYFFGSLKNQEWDFCLVQKVSQEQSADAGTDDEDLRFVHVGPLFGCQWSFGLGRRLIDVCFDLLYRWLDHSLDFGFRGRRHVIRDEGR